jgi:hypothetical protein
MAYNRARMRDHLVAALEPVYQASVLTEEREQPKRRRAA